MKKIIPVEPIDIPLLLETILKEFPYRDFDEESLHERALQPSVFIFKIIDGKKLAGFIDLEFLSAETGSITAMAILEKFRGKSLGKELVNFAIAFFKKQGCSEITLLVKRENAAAKSIYKNAGFKKTGALEKKIDNSIVEEMKIRI